VAEPRKNNDRKGILGRGQQAGETILPLSTGVFVVKGRTTLPNTTIDSGRAAWKKG
jgi:hypothetical protein